MEGEKNKEMARIKKIKKWGRLHWVLASSKMARASSTAPISSLKCAWATSREGLQNEERIHENDDLFWVGDQTKKKNQKKNQNLLLAEEPGKRPGKDGIGLGVLAFAGKVASIANPEFLIKRTGNEAPLVQINGGVHITLLLLKIQVVPPVSQLTLVKGLDVEVRNHNLSQIRICLVVRMAMGSSSMQS